MSPRRPPPRPASRDWPGVMSLFPASRDGPSRGKRRHSSEASAFPALGKNGLRETPANTGPRLLGTISGTAFLAVAVAHCCALVRLSRNRSAVLRSCPTSEAALSADIRGDFPQKKRRPSARRPVFPLPAWEQPTQSKKITAKACFPSPRVKTAAPGVPPRPTSRMTQVFNAPHGNDARALFFPRQPFFPPPGRTACVLSSSVGRPAGLFGRKGGGVPTFSRSAQEHSAWRKFPRTAREFHGEGLLRTLPRAFRPSDVPSRSRRTAQASPRFCRASPFQSAKKAA